MPKVPETTSAESIGEYARGQTIAAGKGHAWEDVQLSVRALPPEAEVFSMPTTSEPMIAWTTSGEAVAEERVDDGPWRKSHLTKGSMYLTAAGAPYQFRWKTLTAEPFEVTVVVLSLRIFREALEEVLGPQAGDARLKDLSGFKDPRLTALLQELREEASRRIPSRLFVRGIAQAISVYLAREYTVLVNPATSSTSALPAFRVRRITDWMSVHFAEPFNLAALAKQAGISEFHFNRQFKRATGVPPSRYHIQLRIERAKRLLRETRMSVIAIANEVGYANPSHFARIFRKESGVTPTDYRAQS